jgi:hypothetical protein
MSDHKYEWEKQIDAEMLAASLLEDGLLPPGVEIAGIAFVKSEEAEACYHHLHSDDGFIGDVDVVQDIMGDVMALGESTFKTFRNSVEEIRGKKQ